MAGRAVAAWKKQCQNDPACQIIVLGQRRGRRSATIQKELRPQDRFVCCDSRNEAELYNAGARATDAKWLLFTESHVLPTAETVHKLKQRLQQTTAAAAVLGSSHLARSRFSAVDAALHECESPSMHSLGLWRCVGLRGFVVRRYVFEQLGGFNTRYFRFAETAFAIRLTESGHHLVAFDDVVVQHVDSDSLPEIFFAMKFGRLGACRFHHEEPMLAMKYFGCPVATTPPGGIDVSLARWLWRQPFQALLAGKIREASRMIRLALPTVWAALAGNFSNTARAIWRCGSIFSKFIIMLHGTHRHLPPTHPALTNQYFRLREVSTDFGTILFQCELASTKQALKTLRPTASTVQATDCRQHGIGFYGPEQWHEEVFCWSTPQAGIRMHLPPGEQTIQLDIRPTGQLSPRQPTFFLNGDKLPDTAWREENGFIKLQVNQTESSNHVALLSWTCRGFRPARSGLPDHRRLGLALISATFVHRQQQLNLRPTRQAA
jgi:hypothetical protein